MSSWLWLVVLGLNMRWGLSINEAVKLDGKLSSKQLLALADILDRVEYFLAI